MNNLVDSLHVVKFVENLLRVEIIFVLFLVIKVLAMSVQHLSLLLIVLVVELHILVLPVLILFLHVQPSVIVFFLVDIIVLHNVIMVIVHLVHCRKKFHVFVEQKLFMFLVILKPFHHVQQSATHHSHVVTINVKRFVVLHVVIDLLIFIGVLKLAMLNFHVVIDALQSVISHPVVLHAPKSLQLLSLVVVGKQSFLHLFPVTHNHQSVQDHAHFLFLVVIKMFLTHVILVHVLVVLLSPKNLVSVVKMLFQMFLVSFHMHHVVKLVAIFFLVVFTLVNVLVMMVIVLKEINVHTNVV